LKKEKKKGKNFFLLDPDMEKRLGYKF